MQRRGNHIREDASSPAADTGANSGDEYHLHRLDVRSSHSITVDVLVNGRPLGMELDTGAAVSILSEKMRPALFADLKLRRSTLRLKTYTEEQMHVTGQLHVAVQYGSQ